MQTNRPTPEEIIDEIVKSFESLPKKLEGAKGDSAWTKQLKKDLGELGEQCDWKICTGGFKDRFENGWLYDLVWYKVEEEEKGGHLSEVYLVLESEWGRRRADIKYDFEKLLLAKSTLKVMVFQTNNLEVDGLFDFLQKGIRSFLKLQCADECYLLIAYNNDTSKFDVRQYSGSGELIAKAK